MQCSRLVDFPILLFSYFKDKDWPRFGLRIVILHFPKLFLNAKLGWYKIHEIIFVKMLQSIDILTLLSVSLLIHLYLFLQSTLSEFDQYSFKTSSLLGMTDNSRALKEKLVTVFLIGIYFLCKETLMLHNCFYDAK